MGRIKNENHYISDTDYESILSRIYKIAEELDITVWITFGTLLGYAQQGKKFACDNDIDIGTTTEGFDILEQNLDVVRKYGFFIREKKREPLLYRGLFIYDPLIQPFHVDMSEFIINDANRYTFRWLIRITPPAKMFHYLNKLLMQVGEFTNHGSRVPYKDSNGYKKLHQNKISKNLIDIIAYADYYFTTTRELGMNITHFRKDLYYNVWINIPMPMLKYCEVNYGKNWNTPIKKRHTAGGNDCYKYTKDNIERCYIE